MTKAYIIAVLFGLLLFTAIGFAITAKNDSAADTIFTKLLKAVENNDLDRFIEDGDNQFKTAITKRVLESVNAIVAPHMKKGYEVIRLGTLNQQGCQVYLSKLVFKDGSDDVLAKLALRDGKVAGFWFL
jgi:hypothetical protein